MMGSLRSTHPTILQEIKKFAESISIGFTTDAGGRV
jgi:hypothetical protein